jgi:type I restriction enzyme M protein
MNLAVHGLAGDIRQGNSYYEDLHRSTGKADFVMANPPFNVDRVDKDRLKDDPRFPFGLPRTDNANYLWIQLFYSALNDSGRAGFVMANSASDARGSELDIRKQLIEARAVDVMVAVGSNFFYTVTLPCTLWFLDKSKAKLPPSPSNPSPSGRGSEHFRGGLDFSGLLERTRQLRKTQTTAEAILWEMLRDRRFNDLKFRRQHQIGDYISDFYCHEKSLVIELDGPVHEGATQKVHDRKRDAYLRGLGHNVLRFSNDQVLNNPEKVLSKVAEVAFPLPVGEDLGEGHRVRGCDTVLFIDARHLYRQIDRAHRDWTPAQIEFLSNIARLYRGEEPENLHDSAELVAEHFGKKPKYADVAGLCKVATLAEIEAQGWSLNPGRYVGVAARAEDDFDFKERLEEQNEELETLNAEARELEERIAENVVKLLEAE